MKPNLENRIDFEQVNELLEYDKETGLFRWIVRYNHKCKKGWFAGTLRTRKCGYQYYTIRIDSRSYMASNVAWLLVNKKWPEQEIDHKNQDSLVNRWDNLRESTISQNRSNRKAKNNSLTGEKGVRPTRSGKKYISQITIKGKNIFLGHYDTIEQASNIYKEAARKYHGDFYFENYINKN